MSSQIIIDSDLTLEDAIKQNPAPICPEEILKPQKLVEVFYYSFEGKLHTGQLVVDKELAQDVGDIFNLIKNIKFPITPVIPISNTKFY